MDIATIGLTALELLSPLLVAGLGWLGVHVTAFVRANVSNTYLRSVLERLDDVVVTTVKEIEQTVVAEIKSARSDGTLDAVDKQRIKSAALSQVKALLGPKGIGLLTKVLGLGDGSTDTFIASKIEAAVHDMRKLDAWGNPLATVERPAQTNGKGEWA